MPATFSVIPGGPPDVDLARGTGQVGYPGVTLEGGPATPQPVKVILGAKDGLQFEPEAGQHYHLTVFDAEGETTLYVGSLSPDRHTLAFPDVDLGLPEPGSSSAFWVAIRAIATATPGHTTLSFVVGDQSSPSTPINVIF